MNQLQKCLHDWSHIVIRIRHWCFHKCHCSQSYYYIVGKFDPFFFLRFEFILSVYFKKQSHENEKKNWKVKYFFTWVGIYTVLILEILFDISIFNFIVEVTQNIYFIWYSLPFRLENSCQTSNANSWWTTVYVIDLSLDNGKRMLYVFVIITIAHFTGVDNMIAGEITMLDKEHSHRIHTN